VNNHKVYDMRPPQALQSHRKAVLQHHALNVRVFGSVLHGKDMDDSDLGLLVEPTLEAVTNNPDKFPAGYASSFQKLKKSNWWKVSTGTISSNTLRLTE